MTISYHTEDTKSPKIDREITSCWIKRITSGYNRKIGEITYIFCSDKKILEINQTYLHHDYYTDIITFDYSEKDKISGDIFISLDTVKSNSEKFNTLYEEELYRTVIHGILHLCGIDDKKPGEREIMEEHENNALAILSKEFLNSK